MQNAKRIVLAAATLWLCGPATMLCASATAMAAEQHEVRVRGDSGPAGMPPRLSRIDRIRLAEAFRVAASLGNRFWAGWERAPFAVLLVTAQHEFMVRHPNPPKGFEAIANDTLLHSVVFYRKRQFDTHFLATFPVNKVPTI